MAHLWPFLNVVGIDPWAPSLTLARENVRSAGLTDRIRLREQAVEDLSDTDAFDLAWIPSAFMPETVVPAACEHVYHALRPGGWLLFAMANPGDRSGERVSRPTANGALGWLSDGPRPGRDTLEGNGIP